MSTVHKLNPSEIDYAIEHNEFSPELLGQSGCVAVILTQDWCPQWQRMSQWLPEIDEAIHIYAFEYNKSPLYEKCMTFKETVWNNAFIPYVRYYKDGKLIAESNYLEKENFQKKFS